MRIEQLKQEINSVAENCLLIFKKYCSYTDFLRIGTTPEDYLSFQIIGGFESTAVSRNEKIRVVNLFDDYWFTFKLQFGKEETLTKHYEHFLKEILVKVYHGLNNDENKKLLFRVEWSIFDTGIYEHAQPHWHFHPYEVLLVSQPDSFKSYLELKNEEEKNLLDAQELPSQFKYNISKFHFSIGNDWHKGEIRSHIIKLNENNVTKWLEGLLNHIKNQLMYCSVKIRI